MKVEYLIYCIIVNTGEGVIKAVLIKNRHFSQKVLKVKGSVFEKMKGGVDLMR